MADHETANHALLGALSHPLRRRIMRTMPEDADEAVSPRELSRRLEVPLPHLSYHVRVLAGAEAIALTRTERVKGATQHFYRSTLTAPWARAVIFGSDPDAPEPG